MESNLVWHRDLVGSWFLRKSDTPGNVGLLPASVCVFGCWVRVCVSDVRIPSRSPPSSSSHHLSRAAGNNHPRIIHVVAKHHGRNGLADPAVSLHLLVGDPQIALAVD